MSNTTNTASTRSRLRKSAVFAMVRGAAYAAGAGVATVLLDALAGWLHLR